MDKDSESKSNDENASKKKSTATGPVEIVRALYCVYTNRITR